jgi:dTDP-4-dehydrorhamnose reductase
MRVLILGGAGMLGHKLWQALRDRFDVYVSVRREAAYYARFDLFEADRLRGDVDAFRLDDVQAALTWARPDVVVNAVGIIKQLPVAADVLVSLEINALLPQRLALVCRARRSRLIHFSTDCVFSGLTGGYTEDSLPDATDLYGRTKFLGEVDGDGVLTLRTSIVGRELETSSGLLEWTLAQRGRRCTGYARAVFSGLTTEVVAGLVGDLIADRPDLSGLYHVSGDPIAKHDLLRLIDDAYQLGLTVERETEHVYDRSLDSTRFRRLTGWQPPPWPEMIARLRKDSTPYDEWRERRARYGA